MGVEHKTTVVTLYEVGVTIHGAAHYEPEHGELEATAEAVREAVVEHLPLVAEGPVAIVDLDACDIEIDCTISAHTPEELHEKVARVSAVMLETANSFEYSSSSTHRLEPALA